MVNSDDNALSASSTSVLYKNSILCSGCTFAPLSFHHNCTELNFDWIKKKYEYKNNIQS